MKATRAIGGINMLGMRLHLDSNSSVPMFRQLADQLREAIIRGDIKPGAKLPSHRLLARILGVSRSVIISAYNQLMIDDFADSVVGSGTYVSRTQMNAKKRSSVLSWSDRFAATNENRSDTSARLRMHTLPSDDRVIHFESSSAAASELPISIVHKIMKSISIKELEEALNYLHPQGLKELRKILATRLRQSCQEVSASNIIITGGAQQAIQLLLYGLVSPDDKVIIEEPTHCHIVCLAKMMKLRVIPVRRTSEGFNFDELESLLKRVKIKLVYTMSCSHNPTGSNMPERRKEALVRVCESYGVPIIDDTVFSELQYNGFSPRTLRCFDSKGCVVEVGSLSKTFSPGLRIGWIVAHHSLIEKLVGLIDAHTLCVPGISQLISMKLLSSGEYDLHRERLIEVYGNKRMLMERACNQYLPTFVKYGAPDGGYFFWLEFPEGFDTRRLASIAERKGVIVLPGTFSFFGDGAKRYLRLSFVSPSRDQIEQGIKILSDAVAQYLKEDYRHPDPSEDRDLYLREHAERVSVRTGANVR